MSANIIMVEYKYVADVHFFKSADPKAAGLCVAHPDPSVAYKEVSVQLSKILGQECPPEKPLDEFLVWLKGAVTEATDSFIPVPAAVIAWCGKHGDHANCAHG